MPLQDENNPLIKKEKSLGEKYKSPTPVKFFPRIKK